MLLCSAFHVTAYLFGEIVTTNPKYGKEVIKNTGLRADWWSDGTS